MALAASVPSCRPSAASSSRSSGKSSGSTSRSLRQLARREQLERAREAVVVVHERAGDHELVQQDAVRVELRARHARRRRARACPPRFSCASAASIAVPLPEHSSATSNGSSTRSCGIGGVDELVGLRPCARRASRTARGASPCGSLTTMSSTPSAFSAATDRNPIGPPPVTSQRVPGRAPPACVMPCSATASGSVSAACLSERWSGTRSASAARIVL